MKQTGLGLDPSNRRTCRRTFLDEMECTAPMWGLVETHSPVKPIGRLPFLVESMLVQNWFGVSDLAMEGALFDGALHRQSGVLVGMSRLRGGVRTLRFCQPLQEHKLAEQLLQTVKQHLRCAGFLLKVGTPFYATLIARPRSTKTTGDRHDLEMHQTKKYVEFVFRAKRISAGLHRGKSDCGWRSAPLQLEQRPGNALSVPKYTEVDCILSNGKNLAPQPIFSWFCTPSVAVAYYRS